MVPLALALLTLLWATSGCSKLNAWKGGITGNYKTGDIAGELKGADGQYNENTGLNFSSGDNSIPALIVAGAVGVAIMAAYPIQRSLRLRRERKLLAELKLRQSLGKD